MRGYGLDHDGFLADIKFFITAECRLSKGKRAALIDRSILEPTNRTCNGNILFVLVRKIVLRQVKWMPIGSLVCLDSIISQSNVTNNYQ